MVCGSLVATWKGSHTPLTRGDSGWFVQNVGPM